MSSTSIALVSSAVPAHVTEGTGLGNENVGQHVTIPRVKLLQKMSDEVDKYNSKYIAGAEPGHFFNSLTGQNYGEELYVINLLFRNEYVVWRNREAGGGILGSFSSMQDAQAAIKSQQKPEDYTVTDTHSHVLLIKNPATGELDKTPVIMDFSSSKMRISRSWNSIIGIKGGNRFSGLWKLKSVSVQNKTGAQYMNLESEFVGWATDEDYQYAKSVYSQHANLGNLAD
jgi:hypothetical protein